jgi:hypothetical protein
MNCGGTGGRTFTQTVAEIDAGNICRRADRPDNRLQRDRSGTDSRQDHVHHRGCESSRGFAARGDRQSGRAGHAAFRPPIRLVVTVGNTLGLPVGAQIIIAQRNQTRSRRALRHPPLNEAAATRESGEQCPANNLEIDTAFGRLVGVTIRAREPSDGFESWFKAGVVDGHAPIVGQFARPSIREEGRPSGFLGG